MKHDGGPAFPQALNPHVETGGAFAGCEGISMRDYFAARAMEAKWPTWSFSVDTKGFVNAEDAATLAANCYALADAMLAERAK